MTGDALDVLVVGAGPVGLTLALSLARQNVRVGVVERSAAASTDSKAVTIHARSLEMFRILGVASALVDAGVAARTMSMHVGTRLATTLRYDRLPSAYPFVLHLHQGMTEKILDQAVRDSGVEVQRSTVLKDFTTSGDGVLAQLDTNGETRAVHARFLVGCDGGHSRVRQRLGLAMIGERHENNWIMADVRIPNMHLAKDVRHGFILEDYPCVVLPMRDGYCRLIAARGGGSPRAGLEPSLDEFQEILARVGLSGWRLEDPLWLTHYNPSQFIASRFAKGRVFIAGDAAHVNSPIAAQGLNTGVMDAMNLAWKLAWALQHGASPALLDSYQAERYPVVRAMFAANDRLTRMVFGRNRLLRSAARFNLRFLRIPRLNLRNVTDGSQLGVHYRDSSVIQTAYHRAGFAASERAFSSAAPRPGDRAPHAALGTEWLYDRIAPSRHLLLLLGGSGDVSSPARSALAEKYSSWLDVNVVPGEPDTTFGARSASALLVRPDSFIAARFAAAEVDEVERYLRALSGACSSS